MAMGVATRLFGGIDGLWIWTRLKPQCAKQVFALSQGVPDPAPAELEIAQAAVPMRINPTGCPVQGTLWSIMGFGEAIGTTKYLSLVSVTS
jgi:hypothetical protein